MQVGGDYRLSDRGVIGGLFAYYRTDSEFDTDKPGRNFVPANNEGNTDADTYSITLFGSYNVTDNFFLDGSLGYGYTDYTFRRRAVFQETNRVVPQINVRTVGDTDGHEFSTSAGIGYDFHRSALTFGPYTRVNFARSEIDGYTEDDKANSGLQLVIDKNSRNSLTTVLGARASYAVSVPWGVLVPQARFEYEHEFDKDAQTTTTTFALDASQTQFKSTGDDPDRNYFNLGAGLLLVLPNGWMPFVDFESLVGYEDLRRYKLTAGLRVEF